MRRPLSARRAGSVTRQRGTTAMDRIEPVTRDEVDNLKRERLELLEEKKNLTARIARLQVQNKSGSKPVSVNKQFSDRINQEKRSLEVIIANQRKKIRQLSRSDKAVMCRELQEEAKIVHQELLRLNDVQESQRSVLIASGRDLEDLLARDGPNVIDEQNEKIYQLEAKLQRYKHANKKLEAKVGQLRGDRAISGAEPQEISRKAERIRSQIADIEEMMERNETKYETLAEEHAERVQRLRQALLGDT